MRAWVAAAAFTLAIATNATGGIEHTVLHGVSVAAVRVWTGPGTVPGLTKERLQGVVEARLREAGITLSPTAVAELGISATVMVSDSGACFASLDARLTEDARLVRNGLRVDATSWQREGLVSVDVDTCAERVVDATNSALADFIETYHAMNPGSPAGR